MPPLVEKKGDNTDLTNAFPASLGEDALKAVSVLGKPQIQHWAFFSVTIGREKLSIPIRIYHYPSQIDASGLSERPTRILDCLLTRHHDGHVRQKHLLKILDSEDEWAPPSSFS